MTNAEQRFDWPLCYDAENFVLGLLETFTGRHLFACGLAEWMQRDTGTLLLDWVDYVTVPAADEAKIRELGFVPDPLAETPAQLTAFWHPEAMLPRLLVNGQRTAITELGLRCESVADFLVAHQLERSIEGAPLTGFRRVLVSEENNARLVAVERRGSRGYVLAEKSEGTEAYLRAAEIWATRRRRFADDAEGYRSLLATLDRVVALVGQNLACHLVFAEERAYWQSRNRAAQIQKTRQDALGLGWGNHDHHTFRSSRRHFVDLMHALEKLGFVRRERYYAGAQAGWGAQILEQPVEGIVTFCDVDLGPDETAIDFSRQPLPPGSTLGTIGLWVGLHGESFLDAGLHHLECRFDYEALRDQLATEGVPTMKPFSDFPFLKQAFTEGERWPVRRERAERLLQQGLIDEPQFQSFLTEGAIGSHLENLQRKGGFKGFNQKSVSAVIQATDPRRQNLHD